MTKPVLPEPSGIIVVGTQALRAFTAEQMLAFRAEGVAEERERCAKVCESLQHDGASLYMNSAVLDCASAIRATHPEDT